MWWWLLVTVQGKKYLLGPYNSSAEADEKATEFTDSTSYPLPTRDDAKAARIIKHKLSVPDNEGVEALGSRFKREAVDIE